MPCLVNLLDNYWSESSYINLLFNRTVKALATNFTHYIKLLITITVLV